MIEYVLFRLRLIPFNAVPVKDNLVEGTGFNAVPAMPYAAVFFSANLVASKTF
jgi:hypothetical protein